MLSLFGVYHELQRSLICPHSNGAARRRLDEADGKSLVQTAEALARDYGAQGAQSRFILGNITVHVARPRRALHLDALAHQVQREHGRLGNDTTSNTGRGITRAPWKLHVGNAHLECLVRHEEDAHVRYDLRKRGRDAAEEAAGALVLVYRSDGAEQAAVDLVGALGGEARAQQIERVGHDGGGGAGGGARDEALGGVGQLDGQLGLEEERDGAVGGKLRGGVADVHQLGGHIALPKGCDALMAEDMT